MNLAILPRVSLTASGLTLTLRASPNPVVERNELTLNANITNADTTSADGVALTIAFSRIPVIFVRGSVKCDPISSPTGQFFTCNVGRILGRGTTDLQIVVTPQSTGTLSLSSQASFAAGGPLGRSSTSNKALATVTVSPMPATGIEPTGATDTLPSGGGVTIPDPATTFDDNLTNASLASDPPPATTNVTSTSDVTPETEPTDPPSSPSNVEDPIRTDPSTSPTNSGLETQDTAPADLTAHAVGGGCSLLR